jgi:phosphatidylserine decarboxylase
MAVAASPLIARPGWIFIAIAVVSAWTVQNYVGSIIAVPLWALAALLVFLFRDPEREITSQPLAIVSPVDGQVVAVEKCRDIFLDRDAIKITINMSILNVYSIRSPIEGKVQQRWLSTPIASQGMKNTEGQDSISAWIQTDEEDDIVLSLIKASVINRPYYYVQSGERIGHGQRCGFVRFGTSVEVYIPVNSRVLVEEGHKVHSGSGILGLLIHK